MRYRVEIVENKSENKTQILIWRGSLIVSNETVNELVKDTRENKAEIINKYHESKKEQNEKTKEK